MARKKVTSSDVAEKAGVSQATVSMVLNHKYNVSFSRETVEKVENAARELGYRLPGHRSKKENKKQCKAGMEKDNAGRRISDISL